MTQTLYAHMNKIKIILKRLAVQPKLWSILEKVTWVAEKNVYCSIAGWNIL
jgi:hypothetical protein